MNSFLVWGAAFALVSAGVSGGVLRYSRSRALLDIPNERSSHTMPTPKGGGIALGVVWVLAAAGAGVVGAVGLPTLVGLALGGLLTAAAGWYGDLGRLSVLPRLVLQFGAAGLAVGLIGAPGWLELGVVRVPLGFAAIPLAVVGLVWLINLYNFMDGVDGIAATQALVAGIAVGMILLSEGSPPLAFVAFAVAAGATGFLLFNWPPAELFMGDVGSYLLGFAFGALALAGEAATGVPVAILLLPLGGFIADATGTLVRRLLRRERVYEAHRSHVYQRLVQAGWSHRAVSLLTGGVAAALAVLAWLGRQGGGAASLALGVGLALVVLCGLVLVLGILRRHERAEATADASLPPA